MWSLPRCQQKQTTHESIDVPSLWIRTATRTLGGDGTRRDRQAGTEPHMTSRDRRTGPPHLVGEGMETNAILQQQQQQQQQRRGSR